MAPVAAPSRASALLLDIEGTTTSITFVKDVLFPYATENVEKYLESSWEDQNVQEAVEGMRQQAAKDVEAKTEGAVPIPDKDSPKAELIEAVSKSLKWLISIDNKNTHMKQLSGFIWQRGYEDGKLKGHLYDDVEPAFKLWKSAGLKIYIYSSGSVNAQKLLMKYSTAGDLQPLVDDYFDTNVGHKREVPSYKNILEKISTSPEETIFFTDIAEEANAANEAGINIVLMSREGNAPLSSEAKEKFHVAETFKGLEISSASVKRKQPTEDESMPPAKIAKVVEKEIEVKNDVAPTNGKDDEAMEVDTEPVPETKKDETDVKKDSVEIKELEKSTIVEKDQVNTKTSEENTEMEVDKKDDDKKTDAEVETVEPKTIVDEKPVETEVKKKELDKTDDIIVSDKDQVPLVKETEIIEKEKDAKDTTETVEAKLETVTEKTDKNGIADTDEKCDDVIVPEVKEATEEKKIDVANDTAKPDEVCEIKPKDNAESEKTSETETPSKEQPSEIDMIVESENIVAEPIINSEDMDDEKLNKLLSEEGAALEKECEEILSKVEQVTNIDIIVDKGNGESDITIEPEITNGHKVDDFIVSSKELEKLLPEFPIAEVIEPSVKESDKETVTEKVNDTKDESTETNNHSENAQKETNGKSEVNGDSVKANGKSETEGHEVNGQNTDHKEKTNGASTTPAESTETNVDQTEIKVKKLPAEEMPIENSIEQLVET